MPDWNVRKTLAARLAFGCRDVQYPWRCKNPLHSAYDQGHRTPPPQVFHAVAEELNFTRAAKRLHVAQPALSQQVRQLEDRLGASLFLRSPRVALMPAGAVFLPAAIQALTQVQHAAAMAARVGSGRHAPLNVGLTSAASLTRLPRAIRNFMVRTPGVRVRVREMHSIEQTGALRDGTVDLGVVREPPGDASFWMREVLREPLMVILPSRHPLARRSTVKLARCADEPFGISIAPASVAAFHLPGDVPVEPALRPERFPARLCRASIVGGGTARGGR